MSASRLTSIDRSFIRTLGGEYASQVEAYIETSEAGVVHAWGLESESPRPWVADLFDLVRLKLELLAAPFRGRGSGDDRMVWEWSRNLEEKRKGYLARFVAGRSVRYFDQGWRTAGFANAVRGLSVLWRIAPLVFRARREGQGGLSCAYIAIAKQHIRAVSAARCAGASEVYLFRLYQIASPFVAAGLMRQGLAVHLVAGTTPLFPSQLLAVGSDIKLAHPSQVYEWFGYRGDRVPEKAELWGPNEIAQLAEPYSDRELTVELPDVLGVYTQGYWLREERGLIERDLARSLAAAEQEMLSVVLAYLDDNPNAAAKVFVHPLERRHIAAGGELGYPDLAAHPRVEIDTSAGDSTQCFDEVGLGVTTYSTVGFDRLYFGFRTLFHVAGTDIVDPEIPTPFARLFTHDADELTRAIRDNADRTDADFMREYFDPVFDPATRAWSRDLRAYADEGRS